MRRTLLEVCVDDAQGLEAAIAGGADRIELCSCLEMGGLTPSPGLVALAAGARVPVRAMIRHRPGDFVFSEADMAVLLGDIAAMQAAGLEGVVLGASLPDGRLDQGALERLCAAAGGMKRTLHRAFDLVPDPTAAVETAVVLGFDTILTSGGAPRAADGLATLTLAHLAAAGRLTIMPGSGVGPETMPLLRDALPLTAIHASCSEAADPPAPIAVAMGFGGAGRRRTSVAKVKALRAALDV